MVSHVPHDMPSHGTHMHAHKFLFHLCPGGQLQQDHRTWRGEDRESLLGISRWSCNMAKMYNDVPNCGSLFHC